MSNTIKKIVGEEKFTELAALIGEDKFEVLDKVIHEHYQPNIAVEKITESKRKFKAQLDEMAVQFETLKSSTKSGEELQAMISELQAKNTEWETKYNDNIFNTAIKSEALKEKARDVGDIMAFIKKDTLKLNTETGELEGLSTQLTELKKVKPYLFDLKEDNDDKGTLNPQNKDKNKKNENDALRKIMGLI